MKKLIYVVIALVTLIIGIILVSEIYRAPHAQCSQPGYEQRYIGWDDNSGACTYPQRVVFNSFIFLVPPFVFMWPVTLGILVFVTVRLIQQRKLTKKDVKIVLTLIATVLGFSLSALIFFTVFG